MGGPELCFGVMTANAMAPLQQSVVRRYQHCVVYDGRRGDESIGRVGVETLKLAGKNSNFAGERQFDSARA